MAGSDDFNHAVGGDRLEIDVRIVALVPETLDVEVAEGDDRAVPDIEAQGAPHARSLA